MEGSNVRQLQAESRGILVRRPKLSVGVRNPETQAFSGPKKDYQTKQW
jgi:hypothetical protein